LAKAERKLSGLSPQEREVVQRLTKGIVAKLLHGPMC
jgi:glutamyl-tRNA reductase